MIDTMYSTGEAAKLLGIGDKTVYRLCLSGQIVAHKTSPNGKWRITRSNLVAYAKQQGIPLQEDDSSY